MATNYFDLIIVGAGCSGLALARQLAIQGYQGSVNIIDSRLDFTNDKTWCYWSEKDSFWFKISKLRLIRLIVYTDVVKLAS